MTATTDNHELRALLENSRHAIRVLRTVLKNAGLNDGESVADQLLGDLGCAIALLARTEARADGGAPICLFDATNPCDGTCGECHHLHASPKDAAPVADGVVATVHSSDTPGHFCIVTPSFPRGTKLYTHPQDASGDAREAERYRWLRDEASRAQLEMFADRRGTRLAADRLCDAGIDIAAMQAKEAK